jgi:ferredoxin
MIPRTDGARPKFQADIDPNLCVSCGVCIGSCPDNALAFGDIPLNPLWKTTLERIAQGGVPAAEDAKQRKAFLPVNGMPSWRWKKSNRIPTSSHLPVLPWRIPILRRKLSRPVQAMCSSSVVRLKTAQTVKVTPG